jgi:hypothetical protein
MLRERERERERKLEKSLPSMVASNSIASCCGGQRRGAKKLVLELMMLVMEICRLHDDDGNRILKGLKIPR